MIKINITLKEKKFYVGKRFKLHTSNGMDGFVYKIYKQDNNTIYYERFSDKFTGEGWNISIKQFENVYLAYRKWIILDD